MKFERVKIALSLLILTFLAIPLTAVAEEAPPSMAEMWIMVPKAGQSSEMTEALRAHMEFRSENGDPRAWQAYTPTLGDNLNRIAVRYCCFEWADLDSYREWGKANEAVGKHFEENVAPHVESYEHYFEKLDWANSHWPNPDAPYKLFAVTEFNIKPGHGQDFDVARDKMSQIALNQGWATADRAWLWSKTIGGKPQESIIIPHVNFASMDQGDESYFEFLARHLQSEEAAAELLKMFSSASWSTDFQMWEHHEDLSMSSGD